VGVNVGVSVYVRMYDEGWRRLLFRVSFVSGL